MQAKHRSLSQKAARDNIGSPETFEGGVYVTRNGVAQLFVQTVEEREAELAQQESDRQAHALLKMVLMAKADVAAGRTMTVDEALNKLRAARK